MVKRILLIVCLYLGCYSFSFSQDSIPLPKDLSEEKNLRFQTNFFKALSEKAIQNYQKAIGYLETCNEILPNNPSVFFEFSKNYFSLNRSDLAKEYIYRALGKKPNDVWMQLHLVAILKKDRNFKEAIKIQKKIANTNIRRKEELVYLYLQDRDYTSAISLMNLLENEKGLSKNLSNVRKSLLARKSNLLKKNKSKTFKDLLNAFNQENSLKNLLPILKKSELDNKAIFNQLTKKGLELYPAQPIIYLYRAKSLNYQKQYNNALLILETGIDFVIDDKKLTKQFYSEMIISYKALGNKTKLEELKKKAKALN